MQKANKRSLSVFMLAMINVGAICNIANLPFTAQYGFSSLFYYLVAAACFFIPVALISAELATGWPQRGGVYIWVREAMGEKMGFLAIWLQWIENVIWYPTILSYTAATFAYTFNPSLAENKFYIMAMVLAIFWLVTFVNFLGMQVSGWISTFCVLAGIVIPGILIITLGISWIITEKPLQIAFSLKNFTPNLKHIDSLSVLAAVLLSFAGLEMSAVHAKEVENPKKNYPRAILLSAIIILFLLSLGSLSIAIALPSKEIQLASGSIEAFKNLLSPFNFSWALPFIALLMSVGSLGMISTWTVGPSKGIMATAQNGELPPFLQKMNKKSMPVSILIVQALTVTILSMVFLFMPSVSSSYRLLFYLTAQLYLIMYIQMFLSGIILKYKKSKKIRPFSVPGKKFGMWAVALIGICGSLFAIGAGFIPPSDLKGRSILFFELFLGVGIIVFVAIPLVIHATKKASWSKGY